ncbi:SRPBCC domain-containing protein [Acetobacteraceae bacterium KSS8]|uniref:SRPBCC domain-containing protein n=1 Tax=Endosaccharibacter trunci TaxID=2812733 RepID=A0ABT1W5I8_9PROT|nr:SRPBCC domain-containing protein [Acetobacteraceae bacterium KSS8]
MTVRFGLVALLLLLSACRHHDRQSALAGEIDRTAPLVVHLEKRIAAPPATVWHLLTDIQAWPNWQPDIHAVEIRSPPRLGARFDWTVDAGEIHSRIVLVSPEQRFAWTGRLFWFRAIHVWTLRPTSDGGTLVSCDESLSGLLLGWFMNRADLSETDAHWLAALDTAATRQATAGSHL